MQHSTPSKNKTAPFEAACAEIEYLNMLVVSAAAASERLPYLLAHPEIDARLFQQQMGSLVCLMQAHFCDLEKALQQTDNSYGRFADFRPLVADTCEKIAAGDDARRILHRHIRNMFAFEDLVHADQPGDYGYIRYQGNDYALAIGWLLETLSCIECKFSLHEILGDAQNTEICTRLCFGAAVNALETWRRDLQLILPGSASVM